MRDNLVQYVRMLFRDAPDTARNRELQEEILQNTLDRYDDLVGRGVDPRTAYGQAVESIGSVRHLWENPAPIVTPPPKRSRMGWVLGISVAAILLPVILAGIWLGMPKAPNPDRDRQEDDSVLSEIVDWAMDAAEDMGGTQIVYDHAGEYTAGAAEVKASNLRELEIHWVAGDITIEPYDGDTVILEEAEQEDPKHRLHWRLEGTTLEIQPSAAGSFTALAAKDLRVRIPAALGTLAELSVDSVSSDVEVLGVEARDMEFDTISGTLTVRGAAEEISVSSVSGASRLELTKTPGSVEYEATSADLTILVPGERSFFVEMDTVSGAVSGSLGARSGKDGWSYDAGTGRGEWEFDTVSGNVYIEQQK